LIAKARFPLLGFPSETNKPDGVIVYQCTFPTARIALWKYGNGNSVVYGLNLYKPLPDDAHRDDTLTDQRDRYYEGQGPITIYSALEAQLMIYHLIQKYLPTEDIDDICSTIQTASCSTNQTTS